MQKTTGFTHFRKAIVWSWQGLKAALIYEAAFRNELLAGIFLTPLAFIIGEGAIEKIFLFASYIFVLIIELLNSAIEATVDRFGNEWHELAGRAKDLGSAAVFLSIVLAFLIWTTIILSHLFN